ncbi:MAG: S49 family peptidase [Betaproteobacteria bacterium]|jgi:protease-4|nr:MAG: S49 family peptidase [Betaproteobacteria bacterium]
MNGNDANWERDVIQKLARDALAEQKRARRWGIVFKALTFVYLFLLLFFAIGWLGEGGAIETGDHTAVVELNGIIAPNSEANADDVVAGLKDAFEAEGTKAVLLRINSPGGSPVQAASINDEIRRLRDLHPHIPLYAVVEDICASGGYYVAVAAEKIFVAKASIMGSIGVLMNGFGFTDAMKKLGIERRLLTAGDNKGFMDPFSPLEIEQRDYAEKMLDNIHSQFIEAVREGRGDRLKETEQTFSGLVWTGEESIELGLADALGSVAYVAREVVQAEKIVNYSRRESLVERVARRFGASLGETVLRETGLELR